MGVVKQSVDQRSIQTPGKILKFILGRFCACCVGQVEPEP